MRLENLPPFLKKQQLRVVVETPRGCRNKYAYDPHLKAMTLSKVLPEGLAFPCDFGFLPQTRGDDGDPLDVLLLMDAPGFPGCVIDARLIGVMQAKQADGKKWIRNDRFLAVAEKSIEFQDVRHWQDLPPHVVAQIADFFCSYHRMLGQQFRPLETVGPKAALKLIQKQRVKLE